MASQVEQYGAFDASPQPILVFETETGALVDANAAAADLLDYSAEELASQSVATLGLDPERVRAALDGRAETDRWSLDGADGNVRHVTATIRQSGGDGDAHTLAFLRPSAAVGDEEFATAGYSTQQALTELTTHTDDVLWLYTANWQELLFVNDAYEEVFGQPADQLRDDPMALLEAIHPDDHDAVLAAMERLSAGESAHIEFRVGPTENFERWVWVEAQPIFEDGEVVRIGGYTRDVTDRKRRENLLEETRERLSVLHESAPDAVIAADVESGELVQVNGAAEALFGRTRDDLLGSSFTTLHPAEETERYVALFERHVENAAQSTFSQFDDGSWVSAVTGDGERVPVEINARTIELDGRPTVYAIFRDVSERKRTQEQFEALTEMARELVEVETRAEAFDVATRTVEAHLGYQFAAVWTPTDDGLTVSSMGDRATELVDGFRDLSHPRETPSGRCSRPEQ
ncbi:PAS domain S-box protein [Haloarculaceae archaeon H-GB11]|nr:PAS domain S-box protein [Haloarculaceae archaeon H-GB11]